MATTAYPTIPGLYTGQSVTARRVIRDLARATAVAGNFVIDSAKTRDLTNTDTTHLQAGLVMGKVTANGKFANSIIGVTGALHDTSAVTTTFGASSVLTAAIVTEIQRRIGSSGTFRIIGPPTTAGTVAVETVTFSGIASSTTLTITATSADFAAGSIIAANDGSHIPMGVIAKEQGIPMTLLDGTVNDAAFAPFYVEGDIDTNFLVNYSSLDASVQTWLKSNLRDTTNFTFSDAR